jgi:hypothetical protein
LSAGFEGSRAIPTRSVDLGSLGAVPLRRAVLPGDLASTANADGGDRLRSAGDAVGYATPAPRRSHTRRPRTEGPNVSQPPHDRDGGAPPPSATDPARANARTGLVLFAVYLAIYAGFVALSAFAPGVMARPAAAGLNVAVFYGMVLIVAAFALALVYMALCRASSGPGGEGGGR